MNKILLPFLLLISVCGQAQNKLVISTTELSKKKKSIEIIEGSRIEISHFKSLDSEIQDGSKKNITLISGKLKNIKPDTLTVKKFLSKITIKIPTNSVFQIRKPSHLIVFTSIAAGTFVGGYLLSESFGYFLPAPLQWSIPMILYLYIERKVLNPMKTVNEQFYQGDKLWEMTVEQANK